MFKKVLVVDDVDVINIGTMSMLQSLDISHIDHATYCDDAYLKLKKAEREDKSYDLLISDLSFIPDHRKTNINSGQELLKKVCKELPDIKTIAFTVEDDLHTIKSLWSSGLVDGYVCKGRNGSKDLLKAISACAAKKRFVSDQLELILKKSNTVVISDYDEHLLKLLASGKTQDQIQEEFVRDKIYPSSKSAIEKRLKDLRVKFDAQTTIHLVAVLREFGLI